MRLLLDTHAVLWLLNGDDRLRGTARDQILDPGNEVFVSSVTLWEIAVKLRIGKLTADLGAVIDGCRRSGLRFLDIGHQHYLALAELPRLEDHKDPFDQMLVAQAMIEGLTLVSDDRNIPRYGVAFIPYR